MAKRRLDSGTERPKVQSGTEEAKQEAVVHHGRDYLLAGFGLLVELLAFFLGELALAAGATVLLWLAVWDYGSRYRSGRSFAWKVGLGGIALLGIAAFTVGIPYAIKRHQDRLPSTASPKPTGELSPDFHWEFYNLATLSIKPKTSLPYKDEYADDLVFYITGLLTNAGGPSITKQWEIKLVMPDDTIGTPGYLAEFPGITGKSNLNIYLPDGKRMLSLPYAEAYLPNVTASDPVPQGGSKSGFVIFRFPRIAPRVRTLRGAKIALSFYDVAGRQYIYKPSSGGPRQSSTG
ncbi:MAG: hypothetical protein LAN83_01340 [Acidobacteriia bacterium]|nr:hypothetical protein [Terriglobia bacterium]